MKHSLFIVFIITFSACNEHKKSEIITETETNDQMTKLNGTWEMVGYYNYVNNKIADSFQTYDGFRQVKMYTDKKVMWSKNVPSDSTEWFGYGNYSLSGNELTETLEYGSEMMRKIIQEKKKFKYEIILEDDKFSQIEVDDQGNRIYSENYIRIE